jgi:hypothetical protein
LDQANLTAHVHNFAGAGLDELLGDVPGVQAHAEAISLPIGTASVIGA